jgi:hypothetical protein
MKGALLHHRPDSEERSFFSGNDPVRMARRVRRRYDLGRWTSVRSCGRCKGRQVPDSLGRRQALPVSIDL